MRRVLAMLLAALMIIQALPAMAETYSDWNQVVSDEIGQPLYHTVRFVADAVEIATLLVADGSEIQELPEAPEKISYSFLGWYIDHEPVSAGTVVTADLTVEAVYTEADESLKAGRQNADFVFEDAGAYASVTIFGTHNKNQKPSAGKNTKVGGSDAVLEAWTATGLRAGTSLTLEAVITAVPGEGTLSAYTVIDDEIVECVGMDLVPGDRVVFDLSAKGAQGIALVAETDAASAQQPVEGALYANEHLYLTGKLPQNGVIDAQPVKVEIDGEEVIAAYDIRIYANAAQQKKGKTWQPAPDKVQVHFYNPGFTGELNVYHLTDAKAGPEQVATVEAADGWVSFDAESFSTYAVTRSIEKTVSIGGNTYRITVTYDKKAGIPDGAELDVVEVDADPYLARTASALGWSAEDEVFYAKFLDISIVHNGVKIEPKTPVSVTVELMDVTDGAQALEVVHFAENGTADRVAATADENGVVTFTADSFSVFGFGSILSNLLSWTANRVTYTLQGFSRLLNPSYSAIEVALEEGMEAINAYNIHSTLGSLLNALYVKVSTALSLGSRESVVVYSVKNGEIMDVLTEGPNVDESLALGDADGFAVVKDTGYRRKTFSLGDVELNGMMPKNAEAEAETADVDLEGEVLAAFDITINEDGHDYQPDSEHPVSVSIAVGDADDTGMRVWHIRGDGTREEITHFTVEQGKVLFTAVGFSIYAITNENTPNARIGYRFWYKDGTQNVLLSTQYFRYKDVHPVSGDPLTLNEPSIPGMENTTWNRIFKGWSKTGPDDDDENLLTIANLNDELTAMNENDYVEGTYEDLFANLENVYYVTYVDINPNNILATEIVPVAESGSTTFTVKPEAQLRPTVNSETALLGWYDINHPDAVYTPGQANVVLNESVTLYPKVAGGYWLIFNDNDLVDDGNGNMVSGGATFTPPAFYLDEITNAPVEPTWTGYEFGGWYTDADCTTPFEFGQELTHDTTVYAKWIPSNTAYRVVIWKQRTSDAAGLDNDQKKYDYVTSELFDQNVVTGQTATLPSRFTNIYGPDGTSSDTDKAYFVYNAAKTDQTVVVKADGSSVLNVYYDRKPVTMNYYLWGPTYTPTTSNNGTQYGLVDGQYVQLTKSGNTWTYIAGYTYTRYTGTSEGDYYIPDGNGGYEFVHLYRSNNRWYRNRSWGFFGYNYSNPYDGDVYTRSQINVTYTGTRYTYSNAWGLYKSFTGLYGSTLEQNGYSWPEEYFWYENGSNNGSTTGTRTTFMSAFLPTDVDTSGDTVTVDFYGNTDSGSAYVHFLVQNEDETSYTEKDTVGTTGGNFRISDKYIGYHASQFRADNGEWQDAGDKNSSGYYNNGQSVSYRNNLYIRFDRNNYHLTFYTKNGSNQTIDHTVLYDTSISEYATQSPGQRTGYYFTGWYADPGCSEEFDFEQMMPDNNLIVYGGWKLRRVRVVVEPGASNVYMGSQAAAFRIDYDERIDGGLMESAQRAGYILDGWYTDPDFTNRFIFTSPINDETTDVSWDYQDAAHWAAARAAYGDDSEDYDNVRGILHLYAKWIPDTSSTGINVEYDPGEAAIYDSLGNLLTTVPVDPHMYTFEGTATAREAPSNYSDLYTFRHWEATTNEGETIEIHPGEPFDLDNLVATNTVYDDAGEELRHTVTLRAVYDVTGDPNRKTHITYDGNSFTAEKYNPDPDGPNGEEPVHGKTADGTDLEVVTLDKEVNQTIELPSKTDFYLNGWELAGWSFTQGTIEDQRDNATEDAPNFEPGQQVAADNLIISGLNNQENTLYAMWRPKKYTVTVRQVIENGVPDHNFFYHYRTGVEKQLNSAEEKGRSLDGNNSSFTAADELEYYNRIGHVIQITTPEIPPDADYDVRVNAIVTRDDGTVETLNPTQLGNYPILGDVVITYTYSLKVPVRILKRDATNHNTPLTGAEFVLTPVEFNTTTNRWDNAGEGKTWTMQSGDETRRFQEGTYRIVETGAPENYARIGTELFLTIHEDGEFTLFTASGAAVQTTIAELDSGTGRILTVYDRPIRTVRLAKQVENEDNPETAFSFTVTVQDENNTPARNYDVNAGTTNNNGQLTLSLRHGDESFIRIPHGYQLQVTEAAGTMYDASYVWTAGQMTVEAAGNTFGTVTVGNDGELIFTNTKKYALTIEKQVIGGWGDINYPFGFTLTVIGAQEGTKFAVRMPNGSSREVTAGENGVLPAFTLKHNETYTVYLSEGQRVTVTETDDAESRRYKTTWDEGTENTKTLQQLTIDGDTTVTVKNELPPVAPTGYRTSLAPYILMLLCGAALALPFIGRKRKGGGADD